MEASEYVRRMKRCSLKDIDLKVLLDEFKCSIINDIHKSSNLPLWYIFLSIIVAICHWINGSHLKGINFYQIPLILFGIICGGSGMFLVYVSFFLPNENPILVRKRMNQ